MLKGDRKRQLEKRAAKFISQKAHQWDTLDINSIPDTGGVFMVSLRLDNKELALYINYCSNLQSEIEAQRFMQVLLVQNQNLFWLTRLKPEIADRKTVLEMFIKNLFIRFTAESDIAEQMALTVNTVLLLKPLMNNN